MTLPYDASRCVGTTAPLCQSYRRTEPGHPEWQTYIAPRVTQAGCRHRIPAAEDSNDDQ